LIAGLQAGKFFDTKRLARQNLRTGRLYCRFGRGGQKKWDVTHRERVQLAWLLVGFWVLGDDFTVGEWCVVLWCIAALLVELSH